jgi:hypothetical protein
LFQSEQMRDLPVQPDKIQVQSVGVHALDMRRVDVAVDLIPCTESVTVEMVIVGPEGDELCSVLLVENRQWQLDKVMHLRQDAQPGEHVLHVGVFRHDELVARAARRFMFPSAGSARDHG